MLRVQICPALLSTVCDCVLRIISNYYTIASFLWTWRNWKLIGWEGGPNLWFHILVLAGTYLRKIVDLAITQRTVCSKLRNWSDLFLSYFLFHFVRLLWKTVKLSSSFQVVQVQFSNVLYFHTHLIKQVIPRTLSRVLLSIVFTAISYNLLEMWCS